MTKAYIIALAGRGGSADSLANYYENSDLLVLGVGPNNGEWYPRPNGPLDQELAKKGLPLAAQNVEKVIKQTKIPRRNIVLIGYSAGAVVAMYTAIHSKKPLAAVISHSGAYLEPKDLPKCSCNTQFLLIHAKDDPVFSWESRYIPTKIAMIEQGYNVHVIEKECGGHGILCVEQSKKFVGKLFPQ